MVMDTTATSGNRLREERRHIKYTQQELADQLRVSKRTQVNYEKDIRPPDIHYLANADELGLDIMYVVTGQRIQEISENRFDWQTLSNAIEATDQWLFERHQKMPHKRKMKLIKLLYFYFNGNTENTIEEIFSLAA